MLYVDPGFSYYFVKRIQNPKGIFLISTKNDDLREQVEQEDSETFVCSSLFFFLPFCVSSWL